MGSLILMMIAALVVMLICVLGMSIGVLFNRKPIQHCGSSSLMFKGERIDCPLCQGDDEQCETTKSDA